jgi:hypothetical protein
MTARLWRFITRFRASLRPGLLDRDLNEELESHLTMLVEDYVSRGLSPEEALRTARLDLGGRAQLLEAHRAVRGLPLLDAILHDLRNGLHALRRNPEFVLTAIIVGLLCVKRHGRQHMRVAVILLTALAIVRYVRLNAVERIDSVGRSSTP